MAVLAPDSTRPSANTFIGDDAISHVCSIQGWGTRTRYSYSISGTHTLLVLVSSKVIELVLVLGPVTKYAGNHTSTGTSTDILWYIWDVRVKTIKPEINSLTYHK